jgi:hypothetical protein
MMGFLDLLFAIEDYVDEKGLGKDLSVGELLEILAEEEQ